MKSKVTGYDYGECEICNTPMQEKLVKAEVGQWITKLMENSERIAKAPRISVPAIKFDILGR